MRFRSFVASSLLLPLVCIDLQGQTDRLELGLRVRAVELQLESCASPQDRLRVAPHLEAAVQRFFSGSHGAVAEALAEASASLRGTQLGGAERFAASLALDLDARLVDAKAPFVTGTVRQLFPCRAPGEGEVRVRIRWVGSAAEATVLTVQTLPMSFQIPLAATTSGEQVVEWEVCEGAKMLTLRQLRVSVADAPNERADQLADHLTASSNRETVEHKTLGLLLEMIRTLGPKGEPETELPGLELLAEAESVAAALQAEQPARCLLEPGQHWVRIPMGSAARRCAWACRPGRTRANADRW